MAMSDEDFEAVLNKLGLAQKNYSSPDDNATVAAPAAAPVASMPPAEDKFQGLADIRKADDTGPVTPEASSTPPAGYDGSPEANPSVQVPPMPEEGSSSQSSKSMESGSSSSPSVSSSPSPIVAPSTPAVSSFEQNPELNDAAIKRAQEVARNQRLITGLGEAGGTFAAEAAGQKFDPSFYREQEKQADQGVQNIETRRNAMLNNTKVVNSILENKIKSLGLQNAQQASDPNSAVSQTARNLIKMLHPGFKDEDLQGLSANDIKDFAQHILETQAKVDASKSQHEFSNSLKQDVANRAKDAQDARLDQQANKDFMKFSDRVQGSIASSRGDFGKNSNVIRQSGQIQQLIDQIKTQPGGADQRQYYELARTLDGMLSSGQGTITGTKELLPKTAAKQFASAEEYLTSKPTAAGLGDFVKRAEDTVARERKYAIQRNADTVAKMAPGYSHLKDKDTDRWNSILNAQGLQTDEDGNITGVKEVPGVGQSAMAAQAPSQPQGNYGKDVLDYANSHNITPEQANQIKLQRTSGAQ